MQCWQDPDLCNGQSSHLDIVTKMFHNCTKQDEAYLQAWPDMHNQPIAADLTLFVDGTGSVS